MNRKQDIARIVFIAVLLLEGCSETPDQKAIRVGEDAIRNSLRDSDSAQFQNVFVVVKHDKSSGTDVADAAVCGEVNSKNGFGGYTGHERFVVHVIDSELTVAPQLEEGTYAKDSGDGTGATYFETMIWKKDCTR